MNERSSYEPFRSNGWGIVEQRAALAARVHATESALVDVIAPVIVPAEYAPEGDEGWRDAWAELVAGDDAEAHLAEVVAECVKTAVGGAAWNEAFGEQGQADLFGIGGEKYWRAALLKLLQQQVTKLERTMQVVLEMPDVAQPKEPLVGQWVRFVKPTVKLNMTMETMTRGFESEFGVISAVTERGEAAVTESRGDTVGWIVRPELCQVMLEREPNGH